MSRDDVYNLFSFIEEELLDIAPSEHSDQYVAGFVAAYGRMITEIGRLTGLGEAGDE